MIKIPVYNQTIDKIKDLTLSSRVFGVKVKPEVVHQVVISQLANSRTAIADTKGKGEVRGGGRKPWKQKGTGRARHGSIRSPLWKGGGVTFGPKSDRNFSVKVNKKQKQLALGMCLSDKVASQKLIVLDDLKLTGKTKELNSFMSLLRKNLENIKEAKKFLIIMDENDKNIINAGINLKTVNTISADSINCVELLKYDVALVTVKGVDIIEKHFKRIKEKK